VFACSNHFQAHCNYDSCNIRRFDSIKGHQIVEFLAARNQQIPGSLLIIWDDPQAHKCKVVRRYIERDDMDIQLAFLTDYAPELNPVEYLW
jgi:transposase